MKQRLPLLTALLLAACAGQTYRANVGPLFVRTTGKVSLQNSTNSLELGRHNNIDDNFGGSGTTAVPYVRLQTDKDLHRVRVTGWGLDDSGTGTLKNDFGVISAGSQVSSSLQMYAIGGTYGYSLLRREHLRVAIGAELNFYSLDVSARSGALNESVKTSVLVPMPYAEVEAMWDRFAFGLNGAFMSADLGDANGQYIDTEAYGRWQAGENFDITAGYRYLSIDAWGTADSRDFDADVKAQGIFVTAGVKF